jgi:hypothetical protein
MSKEDTDLDDDVWWDEIISSLADPTKTKENVVPMHRYSVSDQSAPPSSSYRPKLSPLQRLTQYSLTGQSKKLKQKMLDDNDVLKGIAIQGQWTTLYASPNTGKTLITLSLLREAILSDEIDGEMVYYINADDNYRGLVEKIELAEDWGMHMLAPHHNDCTAIAITDLMLDLADSNTAHGTIIILDTLKKFTDIMDKRAASEFGDVVKAFTISGGTVISLAHTNKHPGTDGKAIYSGTSDIVDDSDCVFIIDKVSADEVDRKTTHTIEFRNTKNRGDVSDKIGFSYQREYGQDYRALLDTVKRIETERLEEIKDKTKVDEALAEDATIIKSVCKLIEEGTVTKDKIVKGAHQQSGESIARVRKVLEQRTGNMHQLGHRWTVNKGAHNKHVYAVLPTP